MSKYNTFPGGTYLIRIPFLFQDTKYESVGSAIYAGDNRFTFFTISDLLKTQVYPPNSTHVSIGFASSGTSVASPNEAIIAADSTFAASTFLDTRVIEELTVKKTIFSNANQVLTIKTKE